MKTILVLLVGILIGLGVLYVTNYYNVSFPTQVFKDVLVLEPNETEVFRYTLEEEVIKKAGQPELGFTPEMFLKAFPGLTASDFAGVAGIGGVYTIEAGVLTFVVDESYLVPTDTGYITGYAELLQNVARRNNIDLKTTGTITDVMRVLADA
jgi:hypothetical protein